MTFLLKKKTIVLTGGTSGIGRALAERLHSDNNLMVIGRNAIKLEALKKLFPGITVFKADLTDTGGLAPLAEKIRGQHPKIDLLINNAAVQNTPQFMDDNFRVEAIAGEIAVNFTSPCMLISLLLPALVKDTPSVILNINSGLGLVPKKTSAVYCGSKGGLNIFSQSLRHQLAETNISVQQAFMPLVDTEMTKGRGVGKLTPAVAAQRILAGVEQGSPDNYIGKVKLLRVLTRIWPSAASSIMKKA
ncbi:MAG: SDR family NAD(P)-dependent oxidoreductase [Kordiimonadaceae bacterium]|nr:SDR family NAD(P)-dependent oxidoreductase [Kordiimonadaceae bacterium]